jgi:thiol:disulfide interchange protein DsbD
MNSLKKSIRFLIVLTAILLAPLIGVGQMLEPVKWNFSQQKVSENQFELRFTANIDQGWGIYGTDLPPGGPIPTSISITEAPGFKKIGNLKFPKPIEKYDVEFSMNVTVHKGQVTFRQLVEVLSSQPVTVTGELVFMACDDTSCLPPDYIDFSFRLPGRVEAAIDELSETSEQIATEPDVIEDEIEETNGGEIIDAIDEANPETVPTGARRSFWATLITGFLGGLLALLTPCVFPMIPLTVSFFLRNAGNKARAFRDAIFYGVTIVFAYVIIGLAISLIFGADALQNLAANPWFNVFFFALLVFFAASFFGAFELTLPSSWSNALDQKVDKTGGLIGVFFMGLTFVLVSFSCTGPIVGSLLVEAATSGDMFGPAIGMLGFSLALAIPFSLFAIFPTALQSLPKSGGWMNAVKVVLGFIVLAFSLKFLATADAGARWGILDREVFIVLWIAIFFLMGMYLIGKIKFSHDSDLKYLSVPRLFLAIVTFAFVFYLIPGLWGAPLKAVSSFLPSPTTQDFDLSRGVAATAPSATFTGESVKEGPHGLMLFTDLEEGMEAARKANKPVLLDFTGYTCTNCRKMEATVWADSQVLQSLANDFVIVALYTDDRDPLPEDMRFTSNAFGRERTIRTWGEKRRVFQIERFQTNAIPYYVVVDHNDNQLTPGYGYDSSVDKFVQFLQSGLEKFKTQ